MYEIWLMLNIAWEIALGLWPWLLAAVGLWLGLLVLALRSRWPRWRTTLPAALLASAVIAGLAFVMLPGWTLSALSEMRYWVDWATLAGLAAAAGGLALAFAWPVLTWRLEAAAGR